MSRGNSEVQYVPARLTGLVAVIIGGGHGIGKAYAKRLAPDDLAGTVAFSSSRDSDFITGQTLVVDGGS